MSDTNPVTRADLVAKATKSLAAQQQLRDRMAQVAAEVAAGKAASAPKAAPE